MPFVYILKCADDTLYTGWTSNLEKRVKHHNSGIAAKYTRGRRPVELVYFEEVLDKSSALKQEAKLKRLTRKQKLELIQKSS